LYGDRYQLYEQIMADHVVNMRNELRNELYAFWKVGFTISTS
jgi:hypothetical protein